MFGTSRAFTDDEDTNTPHGATGAIPRNDSRAMSAHASVYYESIRNRKTRRA